MKNNDQRIIWIDFIKGLAILSVVFLHSFNGYNVEGTISEYILKYFTSFHMALFFCLSGYLFNADISNYKSQIIKKTKSLVIPYLIYGVIIGFILENFRVIIQGHEFNILLEIKKILTLNTSYLASWFLIVLFETYLLEYLITFFTKKTKHKYLLNFFINVCMLILGFIFSNYPIFNLFKIKWVFISCYFFYFGYVLKKIKLKTIYSIIFIVIGSIICFINSKCTYSGFEFGNIILFLISSCCSIIGWINLIDNIYINKNTLIDKLITSFGKNSIIVLLTHLIYLYIFRVLEKILNMEMHTFPPYIIFLILVFLEIITIKYMPNFIKKSFGK